MLPPDDVKRCIYCLEQKPDAAFNREHVIPQAFGLFGESNLVLTCVCRACNQLFGDTIDLKLGRDSVEALAKVAHGVKPAAEFKGLGRRSTLATRAESTEFAGAEMQIVGTEDGLRLLPLAQVGFAKTPDGALDWYRLDALPSKEEIVAKGYLPNIQTQGADIQEALAALRRVGVQVSTINRVTTYGLDVDEMVERLEADGVSVAEVDRTPPPNGPVDAKTIATISNPEFRAIIKIALNYLAATAGPHFARMPSFNDARRYVRDDVTPMERVFLDAEINHWGVFDTAGTRANGHYISLETHRGHVFAQLSLFQRMRYLVRLGGHFAITPQLASAHFFDTDRRLVRKMPPIPLPADFAGYR